eukprot:211581-Chlamydomonas_euryale.AAC.1
MPRQISDQIEGGWQFQLQQQMPGQMTGAWHMQLQQLQQQVGGQITGARPMQAQQQAGMVEADPKWKWPAESIRKKYTKALAAWNGVAQIGPMLSGWNGGSFFDVLEVASDKGHGRCVEAKTRVQMINKKFKQTPLATAHFYTEEVHHLIGQVADERPRNDDSFVFDFGKDVREPTTLYEDEGASESDEVAEVDGLADGSAGVVCLAAGSGHAAAPGHTAAARHAAAEGDGAANNTSPDDAQMSSGTSPHRVARVQQTPSLQPR